MLQSGVWDTTVIFSQYMIYCLCVTMKQSGRGSPGRIQTIKRTIKSLIMKERFGTQIGSLIKNRERGTTLRKH